MTRAVMSVMKNTPKVWFVFIFFRPDSVTNPKNLSIYSCTLSCCTMMLNTFCVECRVQSKLESVEWGGTSSLIFVTMGDLVQEWGTDQSRRSVFSNNFSNATSFLLQKST